MRLILEFGPFCLFARTHPYEATRFPSCERGGDRQGLTRHGFGFGRLVALERSLGRGQWDVIACHVPIRPLPRLGARAFAYRRLLRPGGPPLIGLDFNDEQALTPTALAVLARCDLYFKRELPLDRRALLPGGTAAQQALLERCGHKIRPVSLGLAPWRLDDLPAEAPDKSVDIFFAGAIRDGNAVRRQGAALLARLAGEGYRVDLADERLSRAEYLARMARAWLAWSPEGLGWQCFRHFEALAAGSVPLINRPRIELPDPLLPGEHCLTYEPAGDDLLRVARAALADKERLGRMAAAGRSLVMRRHLHRQVADGILEQAMRWRSRQERGKPTASEP